MHAEGQLLLWVLVELLALGEGLGDHATLLDPLGLVVAAANQPACEKTNKMDDMFRILRVLGSFQNGSTYQFAVASSHSAPVVHTSDRLRHHCIFAVLRKNHSVNKIYFHL